MRALLLVVVAGCVAPVPPSPIVSVLKRDPSGCFALMTVDTPIAGNLVVPEVCPDPAMFPTMLAGIDLIEVVIDYGPDVDFAADATPPAPTVTLLVDGVTSDAPITLSGVQRLGPRAYFLATLRAPAEPSNDVRIIASVDAGFTTEVATVFVVEPPPVTFTIAECPTGVCQLAAAVGVVHVVVGVPGDVALPVEIHQTIDGHSEPDPTAPLETVPVQSGTEADVAIPVPNVQPGALWVLQAQVNAAESASIVAMLEAPAISASLSCGASCAITVGQSVGLDVDAPLGITPATALVTTQIDGVPQLVDAPLALAAVGMTARGLETLVAPATAGTWQIDVTVAGYPATTIVQTIH